MKIHSSKRKGVWGIMIISVADSRKSKVWNNINITWEDFVNKVKNTVRTGES